ncbi:MarR family winged helix-turn-helix transcriptional regulator [Cnuibacter sp. UC19_7]|uniref:MarR family winged helix-turn-helix transcriptional regulator n=1 Tax=Cnuibacter sp. UC19_7 TaxID=3350166 RepID=UPI00366E71A0
MIDGLGTRFESDDASPGFMLWRVTNRWQALMRRTLAPFDLTHVQFVLLAALTWASDRHGVTQSELAQSVRVDTMMVSQVLRALEAKGLVERRPDPADRRARRVVATAAGVEAARAAVRAVEDADEAFFSETSSKRQTLIEHLAGLDNAP